MSDQVRSSSAQIGAELRARRDSLGWKLPDLARSLRIREAYLEAIEAGRIGDLPGTTYALGFVRAYASALGLPGEQVAGRFRADSAEGATRPALSFPTPVPRRGVPAGAVMLAGLLMLAGAYAGWYYWTEHQRTPPETVPPIPDHLLPHVADKPSPSPQVASILPSASAPTQPAPSPASPTQPPPVTPPVLGSAGIPAGQPASVPGRPGLSPPGIAPSASQFGTPGLAAIPSGTGASAAPTIPATPTPGTTAIPAPQVIKPTPPASTAVPPPQAAGLAGDSSAGAAGHSVTIHATAPAWVTVRPRSGGTAVFNRLMHAGDTWSVPPGQAVPLLLTTGNAGATQITVDNAPVASLGPAGTVFRDLPLDPDMLKSGHLPPSRPPHPKPAASRPADTAPAAGTQ